MEPTETTLPIASLNPHPRNYNQHPDEQMRRIAASLNKFGQVRPIVVHGDTIIAGHGVYQAAHLLGYRSLRCTVLPGTWTEEQAMAYLVADNETRRGAEPDTDILAGLLDELRNDFTPESLGFSGDDLEALLAGLEPPDFEPVGIEEQGRLDEKAKVCCPECGHEFTP